MLFGWVFFFWGWGCECFVVFLVGVISLLNLFFYWVCWVFFCLGLWDVCDILDYLLFWIVGYGVGERVLWWGSLGWFVRWVVGVGVFGE